jgi:hypothetical protein
MGTTFKYYKRRFKNSLEPLLVMLVAKKQTVTPGKWNSLLSKTVSSIMNNPTEYLGAELPEFSLVCDILYEIFEQFCKSKCDRKANPFPLIADVVEAAKKKHQQLNLNRQLISNESN